MEELLDNENEDMDIQTRQFSNFYSVNPPYGFVGIEREEKTGKLKYMLIEPTLTDIDADVLEDIKTDLLERMDIPLSVLKDMIKMEEYLSEQIENIFKRYSKDVAEESKKKFIYYLMRDFLGYGRIDLILKDPHIEDISCNGLNTPVYVWHQNYESIQTNIEYNDESELDAAISRLAYRSGRQISVAHPILEGTTLNARIAAYLWVLIENLRSVMICGATASGKTALLNSMSMFIHPDMKVVTIEEVRELRLHENWIPMVTRSSFQPGVEEVNTFDLLKSALRQRPDFIVVGEVRGEEVYTLFQSIAVGHGGLCTIHADSVQSVIKRLLSRPMNVPEIMLPLMNVLIQIKRVKKDGQILRRVTKVAELTAPPAALASQNGESVHIHDRFTWQSEDDTFSDNPSLDLDFLLEKKAGIFDLISEVQHIPLKKLLEEHNKREVVLTWMVENNMNRYEDVDQVIRDYYIDPEEVYNVARMGANI
jgi:flagellar protein FlaI